MQVFNFVNKKISIILWIQNLVNLGQIYNIHKNLFKQKLKFLKLALNSKLGQFLKSHIKTWAMFFVKLKMKKQTIHLQHKNGKKILNH